MRKPGTYILKYRSLRKLNFSFLNYSDTDVIKSETA